MVKIKTFIVALLMLSSVSVFAKGVSTKFYLNNKSSQSVVVNDITVEAGAENVKVAEINDSAKFWYDRNFSHNLAIQDTSGKALCKIQEHVITHYHFLGYYVLPFVKNGPKADSVHAWSMEPRCVANLDHKAVASFGADTVKVKIDVLPAI